MRDDEIHTESGGWLRVHQEISQAAFGTVFEAEWDKVEGKSDDAKNFRVALKVSLPGHEKDFVRECNLMQLMSGEIGFPSLYGKQLRGKHLYYYSYLPLQTLQVSLDAYQGRLPVKGILTIAVQLLHRLDALHRKGLVMAHLSLENVFLDKTGRVFITELGLAGGFDDISLKEELDNYMHLVRYMRPSVMPSEESLWREAGNYIFAEEKPDLKKLERIFNKHWSNRFD